MDLKQVPIYLLLNIVGATPPTPQNKIITLKIHLKNKGNNIKYPNRGCPKIIYL